MILTFTFDLLKLGITGVLCVASLRFASQLKKIVIAAAQEYGEADQIVKSLSNTYWFVKRVSVCYIVGVLLCNLIKPIVFTTISKGDMVSLDPFTWTKSWSLVIEEIYMVTINTQQLLILLFYYRLD